MPTGRSSTDAAPAVTNPTARRTSTVGAAHRAVVDVGHLVRFRVADRTARRAIPTTVAILVAITVAACTLPALLPGARDLDGRAHDVLLLLPTAFAAFLLLTMVSTVASGGGRELLTRDQGVAFPVSPTTDHLGALLMAPLNIAWLIQAWALLGCTAYALPILQAPAGLFVVLLWLAVATSSPRSWPGAWRRSGGVPTADGGPVHRGGVRRRGPGSPDDRPADRRPRPPARPSPWWRGPCTASRSAGRSSSSSWSSGSLWRSRSGRWPPTRPPVARRATRRAWRAGGTPRAVRPRPPSACSMRIDRGSCGARCRCAAASPCWRVGPGLVALARRDLTWHDHDDPARPGRLRRRAALRRQRLVPRRAAACSGGRACPPPPARCSSPAPGAGRVPARRVAGHHRARGAARRRPRRRTS